MENRNRLFLLTLAFSTLLPLAHAEEEPLVADDEQVIEPDIERRNVDEAAIDSENFAIVPFGGFLAVEDFGTSIVYGARANYFATEDIFIEAAIGLSTTEETSLEKIAGNVVLLTDSERELTYYHVDIGYNFLPGEAFLWDKYAFNTSFYVIAGAGSTKFAGDSRFTLNYGVGYRMALTDWFLFQTDFRAHMFDIDILGEEKTTQNIEWTTGLGIFF